MITRILINTLVGIKKFVKTNPISMMLLKADFDRQFETSTNANLFRGVFNSFEDAIASAPKTKNIGYNHPEPAEMYRERMNRVYASDYPVLFWLDRLLKTHSSVFDLGGHIGVSYYSYKKYLDYPNDLSWQVCDVASVIESAEEVARKTDSIGLSFTTNYDQLSGNEILLASGSLQYIELPLSSLLERQQKQPLHIIVNMLSLYNHEAFVTLQSIGTAYCPYQIFNKEQFISSVCAQGYELIDMWENPEKSCEIAFREDKSLDRYFGMYFARRK